MVRLFTPSRLRLIILFGLAIGLGMNGVWAQNAGKENNLTAGFNWYWNPNMRMMMDWTHGWTQYNVGEENELDIIGLRMQVDF